jgi:Mg/Co/Ni transporter MgtE
MGLKSFILKKVLKSKIKGVGDDQIDAMVKKIEENPDLAKQLKSLEDNKEVKSLLENIQKETEEKIKNGMNAEMAQMATMMKYKNEFIKHREALEPLMALMGGLGNIKI